MIRPGIMKEEVEKNIAEAKTLTFYGIPVTELSKDELMVMALSGMKTIQREQDYHTKYVGIMANLAGLKGKGD